MTANELEWHLQYKPIIDNMIVLPDGVHKYMLNAICQQLDDV